MPSPDSTAAELLPNPSGIPSRDRLIFALDFPTHAEALEMIDRLGDSVSFYKIGLQLFLAADGSYFELADRLHEMGKQTMVDLKFLDVPQTVAAAVHQLRNIHASFATVHAQHEEMLAAAVSRKSGVRILAVTVLTSQTDDDLKTQGYSEDVTVERLVLDRTRRALAAGCDGVVSSGREAATIREEHGAGAIIVTPGIRPAGAQGSDDQKRTMDVEEAFAAGADYIVVGRPIQHATDPRAAADDIQGRIRRLFEGA